MSGRKSLRWSDAWLLAAIYQCAKESAVGLVQILAAADFINHAVPNVEELQSGLFRLVEADLLEEEDGSLRFRYTSGALLVIEPLLKRAKTGYQLWTQLEIALDVDLWIPGEPLPHPDNAGSYRGFTADVYQRAVAEYLEQMKSR